MTDFNILPDDLPVPIDDGAADGLFGKPVPALALPSTSGDVVHLDRLGEGLTVIYLYPRTGEPGQDPPPGWDDIPGARGCTPESCDFRDHFDDLLKAGADRVFGLSSQDSGYQREVVERLRLPYPILSDENLELNWLIGMPTFSTSGMTLYKRLTLIIRDGIIEHVFYPIFPPGRHAVEVLAWLSK